MENKNILLNYLERNKNVIYSVKTLAKRLSLSRKTICYYYFNELKLAKDENRNPRFTKVGPINVGSHKYCNKNSVQFLQSV